MTTRWIAVPFTALAFSVPIAGFFLMLWPIAFQQKNLAIDSVELVVFAFVSLLAGTLLASYVHHPR